MAEYKSVIVTISGKMQAQFDEIVPQKLEEALNDGYYIKEVHQIASNPSASDSTSSPGMVVVTYVLVK